MPPTVILETPRLLLRTFTVDDAAAFYRLNLDPAVTRFTGDGPLGSVEEARLGLLARPIADYEKYGYGRWACVHKADDQVIGFAGLKYLDDLAEVDVGYRLLPAYWGAGLATEAASASVAYGFNRLGLGRIIGLVHPDNRASVRVLEKCGMRFDGMIEYRSEPAARYVAEAPAAGAR